MLSSRPRWASLFLAAAALLALVVPVGADSPAKTWNFLPAVQIGAPAFIGYQKGVPMGGDLTTVPAGKAPTFMVYALRDPIGANLDRIQIVKGWLDKDGKTHEKVYDVVWGDAEKRQPSADGKLPAVGNTVDVKNATWSNSIGDSELITVWQDPEKLRHNTRELAAGFIASGISPEKSILINQSQVPEHAQLGWIFNCVARMGWMSRMTQWKDKAGKNAEAASLGLFGYPALMAADILVYHATHVPVGEDQKQHLELTRDIAAKFNHDYGVDFFPMTEPVIEGAATRVMSLRDGSKKMSKSDPSDASRINMTDSADAIAKKIRKAKTDPDALPSEVAGLKDRPEARNLVNIYAALNELNTPTEKILTDFGDKVSAEDKAAIEAAAADVKTAAEGEDVEDIKQKLEALAQASMKLGEAMYQSNDAEAGAEGPSADAPGGDGGDENVVDVDFEEVKDDDDKKSA